MLKENTIAPEFKLLNQDGKEICLGDFKGEKVLLYFYPKDDTPGCTKEACGFRDFRLELEAKGLKVVGISKDSVKSHKKFVEKYSLPFTLLSDESTETIKKYKAWGKKKMMGREYEGTLRISYLIDEKGKILKAYEKVDTEKHAGEVLKDLQSLE
jgi:peroxiredoxin Q/BCP